MGWEQEAEGARASWTVHVSEIKTKKKRNDARVAAGNLASTYAELRRATGASERIMSILTPNAEDAERRGSVTMGHLLEHRTDRGGGGDGAGGEIGGSRDSGDSGDGGDSGSGGGGGGAAPDEVLVAFRGVHFAYPSAPSAEILTGFNLSVARGERVAL